MPTIEELDEILGPRRKPQELSNDEKERLVEQFRGILGSGVTTDALSHSSTMDFEDIVTNLHLYERLFIAMSLVGKLRGYDPSPEWLADAFSTEELELALKVSRARNTA